MCAFINHDQVEYLPARVIRHRQSLTAQMWLGSQTALWVVLLKHTADWCVCLVGGVKVHAQTWLGGLTVWWVESRYIHKHSWWSDCLQGGVKLNTHTAVVIRWNDCLLQKQKNKNWECLYSACWLNTAVKLWLWLGADFKKKSIKKTHHVAKWPQWSDFDLN